MYGRARDTDRLVPTSIWHLDDPDRFCDALLDFIATTEPAAHDLDSWRRLLSQNWDGVPRPVGD